MKKHIPNKPSSACHKSTVIHRRKADDLYIPLPEKLFAESGYCLNDQLNIEVTNSKLVLSPMVSVSRLHREKRKYAGRLVNAELAFDVFRGKKCISKLVAHQTRAENLTAIDSILAK